MAKSTTNDAQALIRSLRTAYAATPTNLKIIDLYIVFAIITALVQREYKLKMAKSTANDAQALIRSLRTAYVATPTNLKIIDLYVVFAIITALVQVVYMGVVGSFPFNSFLSGVLSCVGTAVLAVCLRIQVNKENKEFKDLPPERAFADFVLCNLVLHLVIMNFLG